MNLGVDWNAPVFGLSLDVSGRMLSSDLAFGVKATRREAETLAPVHVFGGGGHRALVTTRAGRGGRGEFFFNSLLTGRSRIRAKTPRQPAVGGGSPVRFLILLVVLSVPALPALGSEVVGEIEGPDGTGVAGASVLLTLQDGDIRETVSDGAGSFRFDALPEGEHRLTVTQPGFGSRTVSILVESGGQVRIRIPLSLAFAESVRVTGQHVRRSRFEENTSVAVVGGARLDGGTDTDLYRLVAMTPNVDSSSDRRGFSIRGIRQSGFGGGGGLLVSLRVDGAPVEGYQATFFGPFSTWDLDRVEVLRGPQSTQQGRNSLAGAIVMRSADPVYRNEVRGRVRYGDNRQASAVVNVPFAGKAVIRISADVQESDGFVNNPTRGEENYDGREARNVRAKFRFDPTERFRALVTLSATENRGGDGTVLVARFPDERMNLSDQEAEDGSLHRTATVELGLDLGAVSLESTTSVYDHEYYRLEDLDQTPQPAGLLDYTTDDRWFSQELLARYRGARHRGVFGLYFADLADSFRVDAAGPGELAGLPPGFTLTSYFLTDEETRNTALFGEFDLELARDWTLTLGSRFDRETRDTINIQGLSAEPMAPGLPVGEQPPENLAAEYSAFLPKVGVRRDWSDSFSTSVSWQRGYRAGGQSVAPLSRQISNYDPEFTENFEFALRAETPDRRWFLGANAFYTDWNDQQVRVQSELGLPVDTLTVNAGESTVFGAEAEATYWISRKLQIFGSAGMLRTRFDDFLDENRDFTGNEFPQAPRWSLMGGVSFRPSDWVSGTVELASQGSAFSEAGNEPDLRLDGRTLLNARFGVERMGLGAWFYGRNLLDESYLTFVWRSQIPGLGHLGYAGEPRTIGVEISYRY